VIGAAHEDRDIAALCQQYSDQNNAILSSFQAVQGSMQAAGEALVGPLAIPVLNNFVYPVFTITKDCM
jgi:hypothetical protein